jgi:hypothetical protein
MSLYGESSWEEGSVRRLSGVIVRSFFVRGPRGVDNADVGFLGVDWLSCFLRFLGVDVSSSASSTSLPS